MEQTAQIHQTMAVGLPEGRKHRVVSRSTSVSPLYNILNAWSKTTRTSGDPISGKLLSNFSISSSPVTFTSVLPELFGTGLNASKENVSVGGAEGAEMAGRDEISPSKSRSGNAEAAASKSMSSGLDELERPDVTSEKEPPSNSLSRARKSDILEREGTRCEGGEVFCER